MREKNIEVKVGIFVSLGIITLVLSIFAISGDQALFADHHRVRVKFKEATGLNVGSVVAIMGFPIGNVEKIDFEDDSMDIDVTMRVLAKYKSKITQGSIADVRTKGALGDKYIYITPGQSSEFVSDGSYIEASKEQDMLSVITQKGHQIDKIFSILTKIDRLLDDLNGERQAKQLMDGLAQTAGELSKASKEISSISHELKQHNTGKKLAETLENLNSIVAKIDSGEGSLGALINDPSVHEGLKRILGAENYNSTLKSMIRTSIKESENSSK